MRQYDPRIAQFLEEIASTPTGWPLIDWVRLHWPRIQFGEPPPGLGAFCYPWPFASILIKDAWGDEWKRETIAHELAHMIRWRGHLVASLEQEYDAYLTAARVRCEFNGWDWRAPDELSVRHYPLFFGPGASKTEFKQQLPRKAPFYGVLPWEQPYSPVPILTAMAQQGWYGLRMSLGGFRKRIGPKQEKKRRIANCFHPIKKPVRNPDGLL